MRNTLPDGTRVRVELLGGVYHLREPLILTAEDSGPAEGMITYCAAPGARPILDGSIPVAKWERPTVIPRLPDAAQGHVWQAKLPDGAGLIRSFFYRGASMARARSSGWPHALSASDKSATTRSFSFPPGSLRAWSNVSDVEIRTIGSFQWASNLLPLESVDETASIATVAVPATYPFRQIRWAERDRKSLWTENHLEALDEPGEWVVDSLDRMLYFWPPDGQDPSNLVSIPITRQLVRVEGEGGQLVRNVTFSGLTFRHVDRTPIGLEDRGLQHDWDFYDKPDSVVRFRHAEHCAVKDCLITESGAGGIRLDLACENIAVENNELSQLGGSGILVAGYGPGGPNRNGNHRIRNNLISHIGLQRWSSSGILLFQTHGNQVAHNTIAFTPYNAITLTGAFPHTIVPGSKMREILPTFDWDALGVKPRIPFTWKELLPFIPTRDNVVEKNRIYRAKEILGDGNVIYLRGVNAPNHIRNNFIHHCIGPHMRGVIRMDDHQFGTLVEGNVIYACVSSGFISKGANTFRNNYVVRMLEKRDPLNPYREPLNGYFHLLSGAPEYYEGVPGWRENVTTQNVFVHYGNFSPEFLVDHPDWPRASDFRQTRVDGNIFWWQGHPDESRRIAHDLRQESVDPAARAVDLDFKDPENLDFLLRPESELIALKIPPADVSDAGVRAESYPDWLRARLPSLDDWASDFPKADENSKAGNLAENFSQFEAGPLGKRIPWLNVQGTAEAVVVAERQGERVLVMKDSANEAQPWMPLLAVTRLFDDNNMLRVTWRLRFPSPGAFDLFVREKQDKHSEPGPYLSFSRDGSLSARGERVLCDYPVGRWFEVTVETQLGGDGSFSVILRDGAEERTFPGLRSLSKTLEQVEMIGLVGVGDGPAEVEIGRIEISTVEVN